MVNESRCHVKHSILEELTRTGGFVSGEALAATLSISRVSVWKHITGLRDIGYPILSGPTGYRLEERPDLLTPWEFPDFDPPIRYRSEAESTMDIAKQLAEEGVDHRTIVVADRQTKGKGRLHRSWSSDRGGIYASIILRPRIPLSLCYLYSFSAAIAVCRTLEDLYRLQARVKWPNDVLVEGLKIAGILLQAAGEPQMIDYLTVGIGINVNNDPRHANPTATSLSLLTGREQSRKELFRRLIPTFFNLSELPAESILQMWRTLSSTLNREVSIQAPDGLLHGTAVEVQSDGAILIKREDGTVVPVYSGDVIE